eukprot:1136447-Pelagomonas_calceolata.AAC.1
MTLINTYTLILPCSDPTRENEVVEVKQRAHVKQASNIMMQTDASWAPEVNASSGVCNAYEKAEPGIKQKAIAHLYEAASFRRANTLEHGTPSSLHNLCSLVRSSGGLKKSKQLLYIGVELVEGLQKSKQSVPCATQQLPRQL